MSRWFVCSVLALLTACAVDRSGLGSQERASQNPMGEAPDPDRDPVADGAVPATEADAPDPDAGTPAPIGLDAGARVLACEDSRFDCNGDPSDGCEADLTLPASCGGCDNVCEAPEGATAVCADGQCDFVCDAGTVRRENGCVALCGNRQLDSGEECDDGNTQSGDGCSATCEAEPVLDACPGVPIRLTRGVQIYTGTNAQSARTMDCGFNNQGRGRDVVYAMTATFTGDVRIELIPQGFDATLMTRSACPGNQVYWCRNTRGDDEPELVQGGVTEGRTYLIVVSGAGRQDQGSYTLRFEGL